MKFKFEALLSYTKTTKCMKFQGVWCTGVIVGIFRISPIAGNFFQFIEVLEKFQVVCGNLDHNIRQTQMAVHQYLIIFLHL